MNYHDFLKRLYEGAKKVLEGTTREAVNHKSPNDLLTYADLALNDYCVSFIRESFPEASIIAEESENERLGQGLTFVVDPLDGTCNFARGIPLFGIQVAVFEGGECIEAMIGLPKADLFYHARLGEGASVNGKPLALDEEMGHGDGVLSLSDFYQEDRDLSMKEQFALVSSLQGEFLKTRLFGAACIDFTYLAQSYTQVVLCFYRNLWDIAPGLLIAKEAGAVYARINGEEYHYGDESLVVANNRENLDLILKKARNLQAS